MIWRHVLRNSLLPTIAVVATQTGYLIGGLVVIERIFNYPGIGQLIFTAAKQKDFPLLRGGVLIVGFVFLVATCSPTCPIRCLTPASVSRAAE